MQFRLNGDVQNTCQGQLGSRLGESQFENKYTSYVSLANAAVYYANAAITFLHESRIIVIWSCSYLAVVHITQRPKCQLLESYYKVLIPAIVNASGD